MTDTDTLRAQKQASTDPDRLEREAGRAELKAAIEYMTDIASTYPHDWSVGRHYHVIVAAAKAQLVAIEDHGNGR